MVLEWEDVSRSIKGQQSVGNEFLIRNDSFVIGDVDFDFRDLLFQFVLLFASPSAYTNISYAKCSEPGCRESFR